MVIAQKQLRRSVPPCAHVAWHLACRRGLAQVAELQRRGIAGAPTREEQEVLWLDIAMHEASHMHCGEGRKHLTHGPADLRLFEASTRPETPTEVGVCILEDQEELAAVSNCLEKRDDVRAPHSCRCTDLWKALALLPGCRSLLQLLDSHKAIVLLAPRLPDHSEGPLSKPLHEHIVVHRQVEEGNGRRDEGVPDWVDPT
mmetsp:Transcript_52772/g.114021  ORF Transcript_52772/g.114021 Transcript_52772/m.114021 type:complete len:200 (-) Transcript_52772:21-620(-)